MQRIVMMSSVLLGFALGLTACGEGKAPAEDAKKVDKEVEPPAPAYDKIERLRFNQLAVRLNLPLYWVADANANKAIEPAEIAGLRFYPTKGEWVADGPFTKAFEEAYASIAKLEEQPDPAGGPPEEKARREAVIEELDQGRPTLVHSDLRGLTDEERKVAAVLLDAGDIIDRLYARTSGVSALAEKIPADDVASRSLFRRNWGPRCVAPKTEKNPACSAIPGAPKPKVDVYPAELQDDQGAFCQALEKRTNAKELFAPFVVVRGAGDALAAVPYSEAYKEEMGAIAAKLDEAAALVADPSEAALKTYLYAAAQAFRDNFWEPADEAWARMSATNSKWYLRVAPDETYWEPCNQKAGFHMTLARINRDSLSWQEKLTPIQQEMEDRLAARVGAPYKARPVTFHLPDFIDIVVNCGDDRDPIGATIGQSLPNWGPVANEGRGRTVAMTNLYTDPDSLATRRTQASSLLAADTMASYTDDDEPGLLNTILHEATHNLGPSHEYAVKGRTDDQIFGGSLATLAEELKAQTGALWYVALLVEKGILTPERARQVYTDAFFWAFGHISRGMYTDTGQRKPYSQLAAIQTGFLMDKGAVRFDPAAKAANGTDTGAFVLDYEKLPAAIDELMKIVGDIKAKGDKAAAEELAKKYVDGDVVPMKLIAERLLRYPKVSFVYAVEH
ncbi:MAG: hypothetical protein M0R80_15495 [Proteobacteria bacterium]|jgi:hypothetical protein|nr:hypothetical protein [Pseudomonadota bacterium]